MLDRFRLFLHTVLIRAYVFLVAHRCCPCMIAGRIERGLVRACYFISWCLAMTLGRACRWLDSQVRPGDGICDAGCAGCAKVAA